MFWDILAFGTAMTVSQNYVFTITKAMKEAGVILLVINIPQPHFQDVSPAADSDSPLRARRPVPSQLTACGFSFLMPSWGLGINMWEVNETYKGIRLRPLHGGLLPLCGKEKPAGYSTSQIKTDLS